jgi:hypothetical protein
MQLGTQGLHQLEELTVALAQISDPGRTLGHGDRRVDRVINVRRLHPAAHAGSVEQAHWLMGSRLTHRAKGLAPPAETLRRQQKLQASPKAPSVRLSQPLVAAMSHSEPLSRLTVGDMRDVVITWALRRALDKFARDRNHLFARND